MLPTKTPKTTLIALALLATVTTLSADQVTLKNGDRVTGKVVKKEGDKLTLKSDLFGDITVAWDQVAELKTDAPVNVELATGVKTAAVVDAQVPLQNVITLRDTAEQRAYERLLNPGLVDLWAGTAAFGFAGTQGNARTRTLTVGLTAARITRTDKVSIYFAAVKASALVDNIDAGTAEAVRGGWAYNRTLKNRLFLNAFNDYEYDRFQNLDLRFVLGTGLGFVVWKGERGEFDLLGGVAYNRERFSPPASGGPAFTRNSMEAYVGDQFTYKLSGRTSLSQNFRVFPNLSDSGSYRMNFDIGANTALFRWLTWNVTLSDRFLSNPIPGRQKNDFLYSTGVGVNFAR